jgi:hypothetical protein
MVCHLNDAFLYAMGERDAAEASMSIGRRLMKWAALDAPMQWPHGFKTRPEFDQGIGGTKPSEFSRDLAELKTQFARFPSAGLVTRHPIFGAMSREDWLRWGYLHCDHHLRQFGV